jgi:hypothetical protein
VSAVEAGIAVAFVVVAATGRHQTDVAAGGRPRRPPGEGPMATPPLCDQHALVAAVLPSRRLVAAAILVVLLAVGIDFH